jgi:hypothetical protein
VALAIILHIWHRLILNPFRSLQTIRRHVVGSQRKNCLWSSPFANRIEAGRKIGRTVTRNSQQVRVLLLVFRSFYGTRSPSLESKNTKTIMNMNHPRSSCGRKFFAWAAVLLLSSLTLATARAQIIQWGLTLTNIHNPTTTTVVTNGDGSISITTGGGDTYGHPDSFAYAYQQVTGDFDIRVQILGCTCVNGDGQQDSAKASLMVRESLDPDSFDFMINALPTNTDRMGQIESIGRMDTNTDTDDLPGRNLNYGSYTGTTAASDAWNPVYGGDTTDNGYCTYPDVWLRIQRQGDKFMSYFASDNTEPYPQNGNPGSTNGWQLLCCAPAGSDFGKTVYVGLSTVAHNNDTNDGTDTVTSTYANYGPTPLYNGSASIPTTNGVPVDPSMGPGPFPTNVIAVNWDVSLPADGQGYPGNVLQSAQGSASQIIWDSGGYTSVSRDILADINSESSYGFAAARYQCSGFDYTIGPNNPTSAQSNLGPYTNPNRDRYSSGDVTVPACESWCPSPNYGFAFPTIHKTGESWNDDSGPFYGAAYIQLDPSASSDSFDMIGGQFQGGQAYTRTTKLLALDLQNGAGSSGAIFRAAISHSLVYFPYSQGWKAGYFDDVLFSEGLTANAGFPMWKHGDGWGLWSGTALSGCTNGNNVHIYDSPQQILTWIDATNGILDGLAFMSFPGVNSLTDGMLFTVGDDENNGNCGPFANNAAAPDGSGWYVAVRDIATSIGNPTVYATDGGSDAGTSFSFIYIPWDSENLIGGHIKGTDGSTITGAGNYSIQRLSAGRYALTIPGKTDTDGSLMLLNSGYLATQPEGFSNVVDMSFMSYEYGGTNVPNNAFIISSVAIDSSGTFVTNQDADFNFVWVDFTNPLRPPSSTVPPVISVSRTGGNLTIGWSDGPGFILQTTSSLAPASWTSLGTQNPQTVAINPSKNQFFRVVSPP